MCFPIAIPCLIQTRESLAERLKTLYTAEFVVYVAMQGSESLEWPGGEKREMSLQLNGSYLFNLLATSVTHSKSGLTDMRWCKGHPESS